MKTPALSTFALLAFTAPAFAHVADHPHMHSYEGVLIGLLIVAVAAWVILQRR